jgi:DNA-binding IclR family transcriptional regulator
MRRATLNAADPSVLGRIFRVLEAFSADKSALSLGELVSRTGLPRSTVHRVASQLIAVRAIDRTDDGFSLGIRLFEMGQRVPHQGLALREVAVPFMEDLYESTHEIVNLAVLDDLDMVFIEKISGHRRVPIPTRLGTRVRTHCSGLGKALLAFSDEELWDRVVARGLPANTPKTIVDGGILRRELRKIRRERLAVDYEEYVLGVVCVAAPIFRGDVAVAALSLTGPIERVRPERVAPAVRTAAHGISRLLSRTRAALN